MSALAGCLGSPPLYRRFGPHVPRHGLLLRGRLEPPEINVDNIGWERRQPAIADIGGQR